MNRQISIWAIIQKMNKKVRVTAIVSGIVSLIVSGSISYAQNEMEAVAPSSQSAITFRLALRELWQYQVTWTRSYIVSVLSNLEDVAVVKDKLIKNQEKIGDAVKPYYGGTAGDRLAVLLREHIVIATEIVKVSANVEELKKAQDKGRENADAIADLLSKARNPYWDKQFIKDTFYKHLEYVTKQVDYRLNKEWVLEINAYDDGLKHVLMIADLLAEGIVRQFFDRFQK